MIDNNYGKLSGVWKQSLSHLSYCHLCTGADAVAAELKKLGVSF